MNVSRWEHKWSFHNRGVRHPSGDVSGREKGLGTRNDEVPSFMLNFGLVQGFQSSGPSLHGRKLTKQRVPGRSSWAKDGDTHSSNLFHAILLTSQKHIWVRCCAHRGSAWKGITKRERRTKGRKRADVDEGREREREGPLPLWLQSGAPRLA